MKCPRCQQDKPADHKFCSECGTPLQRAPGSVQLAPSYGDLQRSLTESLEQQTATSEILRVISRSPTDVQPVFETIAERAMHLCDANQGIVMRFDGEFMQLAALANFDTTGAAAMRRVFPTRPDHGSALGRAVLTKAVAHIPSMLDDSQHTYGDLARQTGFRSVVAVPMLKGDRVIGGVAATRLVAGPFSDREIALLQTFADQAVIAIENVRLFNDTKEALDQQTATAEILRVISNSPTSLQPVLDAVAQNAARVCEGRDASVHFLEGTSLRRVANTGGISVTADDIHALRRDTVMGRAVIDRQTTHVEDLLALSKEYPEGARHAAQLGYRTTLATPLLREGEAIGVLLIRRLDVRPFTDAQVTLLETFAAQAVIAIENVRLFRELQASNQEIADKSRQLEIASRHKSEFLANMSHELRTPLNAVIGFSEVLSEGMFGQLNDKQEEYARDIYSSGQHLLSLINDILDLSKIEAGRMELEVSEFHLPAALDNALTLVRERAGRRSIALGMTVDERLGQIRADERKIRQVVLNLLSNAIKFTPEGGRIEIRAASVDGSVEVSVTDTGVGIAPEDQEAIFEEFKQVGTAAKKVEGTGLGLALSRKFIELHGGRIWVKSEPGVGSTFTFSIPARTGP